MIKTVSIVDDDKIVTDSVGAFISIQAEMEVLKVYHSAEDFLRDILDTAFQAPSILLLDIGLPGMSGTEAIIPILEALPDLDIIVLTTYEEEDVILKAIKNGACSYISKRSGLKAILDAINIVSMGGSYMSPSIAREIVNHLSSQKHNKEEQYLPKRQLEVLNHLVEGKTYGEIADDMHISIETVRSQIKKMYKTMSVKNKAEAITKFLRN